MAQLQWTVEKCSPYGMNPACNRRTQQGRDMPRKIECTPFIFKIYFIKLAQKTEKLEAGFIRKGVQILTL